MYKNVLIVSINFYIRNVFATFAFDKIDSRTLNIRIYVEFDKFKFDFHFRLKHTNLQKCFRNTQIFKICKNTLKSRNCRNFKNCLLSIFYKLCSCNQKNDHNVACYNVSFQSREKIAFWTYVHKFCLNFVILTLFLQLRDCAFNDATFVQLQMFVHCDEHQNLMR